MATTRTTTTAIGKRDKTELLYNFEDLSERAKDKARYGFWNDFEAYRWAFENLEEWGIDESKHPFLGKYKVKSWSTNPVNVEAEFDNLDIDGLLKERLSASDFRYWSMSDDVRDELDHEGNHYFPACEYYGHRSLSRHPRTLALIKRISETINEYISYVEHELAVTIRKQDDYFYSDERILDEINALDLVFTKSGEWVYCNDEGVEINLLGVTETTCGGN
jgi:hypothetical protein